MKSVNIVFVAALFVAALGYQTSRAQGCTTTTIVTVTGPADVCVDGTTAYPYSTGYSTTIWEIVGGYAVGPDVGSSVNIVWTDPDGTIYPVVPAVSGNCYLANEFSITPISTTITGPSYLCTGESIRLWAGPLGPSYQWKRNGVNLSGATFRWYDATMGGQYTVVISTPYCSVETAQFNVAEYSNPPSVISSQTTAALVPGATVLGTSSTNNHQWYKDGVLIPLATGQKFLVTKSGNYSVKISDANGCNATSAPVAVTTVNNNNFTVSNDVLIPGIKTESQLLGQSLNDGANSGYIAQSISYADLVGKTIQTIKRQASASRTDVIQQAEYDEVNRQEKAYLPIALSQNSGLSVANILVNSGTGNYTNSPHYDFYNVSSAINAGVPKDAAPFTQNLFEPSPLGRVTDQGSVGSNWQPVTTNQFNSLGYGTNPASQIYKWTINASTGLPEATTYWPATALVKNATTEQVPISGAVDPVSESYSDIVGQKIMDRTQDASGYATSYYVYDTRGRLRYVLPPALMAELGSGATLYPTQDQVNRWAFQYQYDDMGRAIRSKTPGVGWSSVVYDKRNRPVLKQNANQAIVGQWSFVKYDLYDRPVITGLYTPGMTVTRDDLQSTVNALSGLAGYQNLASPPSSGAYEVRTGTDIVSTSYDGYREYKGSNSISLKPGFSFSASSSVTFRGSVGVGSSSDVFPTTNIENLTITYFDHYKSNDALFLNPDFQFVNEPWQTVSNDLWIQDDNALGKITAISTKVLGSSQWLNSVSYYDRKGRVIQTIESNHIYDVVRTSILYDFSGNILETRTSKSDDYNITLQSLVNATFSGTTLTKSTATNAWDAGASSLQQLPAGTDGSIETTITTTAYVMMIGLSDADVDAGISTIDYGFKINGNAIEVVENGTQRFTGIAGSLNVSDVLKIQRVGMVVYYLKNDKIVYQSNVPSSSALLADVSIYSANGVLSNLRSSFATQGISFVTGTQVRQRFEYDHAGRVIKEWHQINLQPEVLLVSHQYNALGEEIDKRIHSVDNGSTWLQSIDYQYNIKGWPTAINGVTTPDAGETDYFAMELAYQTPFVSGSTNQRYDGLISAVKWKHDISTKERLYNFGYDQLKRLTASNYKARVNSADPAWTLHADRYSESVPTYDANGNINALNRYMGDGINKVDQLVYDYGSPRSNQLLKVTDNATVNATSGFSDGNTTGNDYAYDANGNMILDLNKGISSIAYNHLDLPTTVTFNTGGYISYSYDAAGTRLSQTYYNNLAQQVFKTDYSSEFIYLNGDLALIFHSEGRLVPASYQNLVANKEANGTEGYAATGNVTISSETVSSQTYVKAVCNETTGTPGIFPMGGSYPVKAGEKYSFKVLGYRQTSGNAYLKVTGNGSPANIVWTGALLPQGSANENWVTTEFIVPAGVTQIQIGVAWSSPAVNEVFYINRVALYKVDWEYQYFLNDHQGSQRVVLGTDPTTTNLAATFETEAYATESAQFLNINSGFIVTNVTANATPGGNEVIRMNNTYRVGPARSMKVFPGDKIDAQVKAYYGSTTGLTRAPLSTIVNAVAGVLIGGNPAVASEISNAYTNSNGANGNLLLSPDQGSTKPSAYLNYILFDEDYKVLEAKSAPLGSANVVHSVVIPQIQVKELGYLFVYLSYDNESTHWVHFDELKISYQESPVLQVNSYFPYGMTAYSWLRDGERENLYGYQGKEYDSLTKWNNFGSRQYDAALGRWFADDPQGNKMPYMSNYAAMMSNPAAYIDPDGECPICPLIIGALLGAYSGGIMANNGETNVTKWDFKSGRTWGYLVGGAIVGGLSGAVGGSIATAGGTFSHSTAIIASSMVNSVGTMTYTQGQSGLGVSFGAFSYDLLNNEFGYLGKRGNSVLQNFGFGFGALANIQDIVAGSHGANVDVKARPKLAGHSQTEGEYTYVDGYDAQGNPIMKTEKILISVGPQDHTIGQGDGLKWEMAYVKRTLQGNSVKGENSAYISPSDPQMVTRVNNVNGKWLGVMTKRLNNGNNLLNSGTLKYGLLNGCVNYNARALLFSGVLNINALLPVTAPVLLNAELAIRNIGMYASPYLNSFR